MVASSRSFVARLRRVRSSSIRCGATFMCSRAPAAASPCSPDATASSSSMRTSRYHVPRLRLPSSASAAITQLVNTHWHFDHTDGNEWLHAAGATIIAHDNTRHHLSKATRVEGWQYTFPKAPAGALPTVVFSDEHRLHVNGSAIVLRHYLPAHTDSDISVQFVDANVLMTGDTWWNGHFPFIDYSTGGSLNGTIAAVEANIAAVGADTIVVPRHGPVAGRAELLECRDMLTTVRDAVAALKKQGRTLKETVAAKPTARFD